jgi:hypothetical protein
MEKSLKPGVPGQGRTNRSAGIDNGVARPVEPRHQKIGVNFY